MMASACRRPAIAGGRTRQEHRWDGAAKVLIMPPTANISFKQRLGRHFSRQLRRYQEWTLFLTCQIRAENQFNGENDANGEPLYSATCRL
jgi:hypothetical protein